ncbi:hypothetical protein SEA_KOZIE_3 [Microbacterium phage Kozie]|uniref:FAD dependent oxidoreductase domain-containing protein n=1 Tax=Microbacterium phage Kozie TaxID=2885981 RepID=A0AAE8YC63_9CAUD|nr:hypothetical protein QC998_gp03 [Microbacterium phage Kozie]UDL16199.1 hypothetical protein SEA_KOZIE_3 [Microbacterium phage Kozie]
MSVGVIGNGFWGSAIARRLREVGHDVTVYADPATPGASFAAAGLVKLGWYRTDTVRRIVGDAYTVEEIEDGFTWLQGHIGVTTAHETFINQMRGTRRQTEEAHLADPAEVMIRPDAGRVLSLQPLLGAVAVETARTVTEHSHVVVAAGAKTDEVLGGLGYTGVTPLHGRAAMFDAPEPEEGSTGLLSVMTRPYNHVVIRRLRGRWRAGDTVERGGRIDPKRIAEVIQTAGRYFEGMRDVEVIGGDRPVCPDGLQVREITPGIIAATGGHRVGLGLSGAVALHVERLIP